MAICIHCGKQFAPRKQTRGLYCSRQCYWNATRKTVERVCERCGKTFTAKRHKVVQGKARYCSRACANSGWKEPCANCGKPVHRTPFHDDRFDHAFCSRECYVQWQDHREERYCQQCGAPMLVKQSEIADGDGKYCCIECYNTARAQQMTVLICQQCGRTFEIPASSLNENMYRGKYCSSECYGLAHRLPDSVRSDYDHEFTDELKEQIRQRDNYTCQLCNVHQSELNRAADVHHIDYDKTNNHPDNLITLCGSCHSKTNYRRSHWRKRLQSLQRQRARQLALLWD